VGEGITNAHKKSKKGKTCRMSIVTMNERESKPSDHSKIIFPETYKEGWWIFKELGSTDLYHLKVHRKSRLGD